jgi:hypothetical protein
MDPALFVVMPHRLEAQNLSYGETGDEWLFWKRELMKRP